MSVLRVAIVADYLEEGWPSMDLVADMLVQHLVQSHGDAVKPTLVRPAMPRRLGRLPLPAAARADTIDRVLARQWDYVRAIKQLPGTLRAALIESGEVAEARITRAELEAADAIWLVNSVRGWLTGELTQVNDK